MLVPIKIITFLFTKTGGALKCHSNVTKIYHKCLCLRKRLKSQNCTVLRWIDIAWLFQWFNTRSFVFHWAIKQKSEFICKYIYVENILKELMFALHPWWTMSSTKFLKKSRTFGFRNFTKQDESALIYAILN